jgi:hypothetical protein
LLTFVERTTRPQASAQPTFETAASSATYFPQVGVIAALDLPPAPHPLLEADLLRGQGSQRS